MGATMTEPRDEDAAEGEARRSIRRFIDDDPLRAAEMLAHLEGPVGCTSTWIDAVQVREDLREAWRLTDPDLRLCTVQHWVWSNRQAMSVAGIDLQVAISELAVEESSHHLWDNFEAVQLRSVHESWGDLNSSNWGVGTNTRLLGPNLELVLYIDSRGSEQTIVKPGETYAGPATPFVVRHRPEGWRVLNIQAREPPVPGWPPDLRQLRSDGPVGL